jgi:hypothetical protein
MESKYFQGDMKGITYKMESNKLVVKNPDSEGTWKYGIVPYKMDSDYSQAEIDFIIMAMKSIESQTRTSRGECIRFIPRVNEKPYLNVINGDACYSYVGRQDTGFFSNSQDLSLTRGACMYKGIIMHELLHALGLHHEHTKLNRNNFVNLNVNNIKADKKIMFEIYADQPQASLALPYDITSIMHFDNYAFSSNGQPTLTAKQNVQLYPSSQKVSLSSIDVQKIRNMYGCN